jgi:hypothetical protein
MLPEYWLRDAERLDYQSAIRALQSNDYVIILRSPTPLDRDNGRDRISALFSEGAELLHATAGLALYKTHRWKPTGASDL